MRVQQRRRYDPAFKKNTVLLTAEPGQSVKKVTGNLGISSELIYRWRRQMRDHGELTFPGHGKMALTEEQKWIREREKKLRDTGMARDIFKRPYSAGHRDEIRLCKETAAHFR